MTIIEQLEKIVAQGNDPAFPKIVVTRSFMIAVANEMRRLTVEDKGFDLTGWLSAPSRINPLAATAAYYFTHPEKSAVNPVDGSEHSI